MLIIGIMYFFSVWSLLSCPMNLPHVLNMPQVEGSPDCLPALLPGLRLPLHWVCHAISVDLKGIQYEAVTLLHGTQCCLTVGLRSYLKLGIVAYVIPKFILIVFELDGTLFKNTQSKMNCLNFLIENVSNFECIKLCLYIHYKDN